uniref:Uncharacterized protein n=1 Tax=Trichogramma kaykai TaxID=54128 RepID=A0ABD2WI76_9HYME
MWRITSGGVKCSSATVARGIGSSSCGVQGAGRRDSSRAPHAIAMRLLDDYGNDDEGPEKYLLSRSYSLGLRAIAKMRV